MEMEVKIIDSQEQLSEQKPFLVDRLLWGTEKIPKTYGYIGFVPEEGFYLKMVCEEGNPLRTYTQDNEPVYRDSAMEAFFLFESSRSQSSRHTYLNFEFNANGALIAAYGQERTYRSYFPREEREAFQCQAQIKEDRWEVSLHLPIPILERIYGPLYLEEGSYFTCNFYKISETKEMEHYASYSPVTAVIPSFHLPEYFADAKIVQ